MFVITKPLMYDRKFYVTKILRGAIIVTRDQLAQWAADWQAACPDFFAAAKVAPINPDVLAAHGRDALDKGRAL